MKNSVFMMAIGIFAMLTFSCKDTQREATADAEVANAEAALDNAEAEQANAAKAATAEQWQEFQEESNMIMRKNEMRIADLKEEAQKDGKKIDAAVQAKIDALEQKNKDMHAKVDAFKNDANQDWEKFKGEFKQDSDELRKALVNFTTDDK